MFSKRFLSPFLLLGASLLLTPLGQQNAMAQAGPGSSGGGTVTSCSAQPIKIDLENPLQVRNFDGQTQVIVDWSDTAVQNSEGNTSKQVDIFMDYLARNPRIGSSQNPLASAFAAHAYQSLSQSQDELVFDAFNHALSQTIQGSSILSERNIDTLFVDYYPYLFSYQLKQNDALANAFLNGVQRGLEGEVFNGEQFLEQLGSELKTIAGAGKIQDTASCLNRVMGGKTLDQLTPGMTESVYGRHDADMQSSLNALKADGKLQAIIDSIASDQDLFDASKEASQMGVHLLLRVWSKNSNVQNLIELYEKDPHVRELLNYFYHSNFGKDIDECIRNSYRPELLELAQSVYLELIQPEFTSDTVYNTAKSEVMVEVIHAMMTSSKDGVKTATENVVQEFINDYLSLESAVSELTGAGAPFTDYYQAKLSGAFMYTEGVKVDIYRNGKVIHTENNPNITQFIDRSLPENFSQKPITYNYYLSAYTECESEVGQSAQATIEPTIRTGQLVNVKADVQIQLKESKNQLFMDRLNLLLGALEKSDDEIKALHQEGNNVSIDQCNASKEALLDGKTSDQLMQYVLNCFGDAEVSQALENQMKEIITPLSRFLELSQFTDVDQLTQAFLTPILDIAKQEYQACKAILKQVQPLTEHAEMLLKINSIHDFNPEQRQWIICGGDQDCSPELQTLMQTYLLGSDYNSSVVIEVYNESGQMILSKNGQTNIFGAIESFELGNLMAGVNYEVKVKPKDQPYALAKVTQVKVTTANLNDNNQFETTIDLKSDTPFFFGNFDNSDDEITLKDIEIWSQMINEDPAAWDNYDIDGFVGVDLFDVQLLQENWGTQAQVGLKTLEKVNAQELVFIFGADENFDLSQTSKESLKGLLDGQDLNHTPYWLYTLK